MVIFFAIQLAFACPSEDLYAVGLNAYVIQVEGEALSLEMDIAAGKLSDRDVVTQWRRILRSCDKRPPIKAFEYFIGLTDRLYELGEEFQATALWQLQKRYLIRKSITQTERDVALSYANFLRVLQRETGIAVRWNKEEHFLAQGVISTARGSDLVADYVVQMWKK